MPIMDGLAATKKIRALEAGFAEEMKKQSPEAENQADNEMPHGGADSVVQRIPIVGLSADIQHTTKEVSFGFKKKKLYLGRVWNCIVL